MNYIRTINEVSVLIDNEI